MNDVDLEVNNLLARYADEAETMSTKKAEANHRKMIMMRERLRAGDWKPWHVCADCLRAILSLDPMLMCLQGKHSDVWWQA